MAKTGNFWGPWRLLNTTTKSTHLLWGTTTQQAGSLVSTGGSHETGGSKDAYTYPPTPDPFTTHEASQVGGTHRYL
ncbi:hypothetical protein G9A89_000438 [Geosiphon pyriformis]|nr:hypothetical protein G9A89_000438 [Geosiphon pyriformis]